MNCRKYCFMYWTYKNVTYSIKVVRVKRMRKRYHERTEGERGDNKISIKLVLPKTKKWIKFCFIGWDPWSSGYGKRLTLRRLLVRIPAPYTVWIFFTYFCCKNCIFIWKRPKINEKEARVGPLFKKNTFCFMLLRRVGRTLWLAVSIPWLFLTNQDALFQRSVAMLLLNLFMTLVTRSTFFVL